jgi:transcriptional regulator with XRE-family HTH domain
VSPAAASALATRDLGVILRTYRAVNHVSQRQLAEQLGYDAAYICLLERGKRAMTDRGSLARIARHLAIPPHILGVTDDDDADFTAMFQFADSTIRLAEIARRSGNAVDAVNELWPLIARLEARAATGRSERDVAVLLVHARVAFGTSLGHILPEERPASAAYWTGKALRTAGHVGEHPLLAHVLRMHGNELRKAGYLKAGAQRLTQALTLSHSQTERGETLALFARAAGELGDPGLFDHATQILDHTNEHTMLFNPFALREIHLRGLLATGRAGAAAALARAASPGHTPTAPQWEIIERITSADVLATASQPEHAATALKEAVTSAEHRHLPHQIQRVIRVAARSQAPAIQAIQSMAREALARIQARLDASRTGLARPGT